MGTVDAIGARVSLWHPGQRVFGIVGGGGYSEYAVTHERLLAAVPDNLTDEEAGAVPEVFMTAHDALFTQAGMRMGERVLIHAAGSGVGTAAIQLIRAAAGTSYGTMRSVAKEARTRELGLDHLLPLPDFATALHELTAGHGVDIVLDFVGQPYIDGNLRSLAPQGRLVQIGVMGGGTGVIDLRYLMQKRLRLFGTVLRGRPLEEKIAVTRRFAAEVTPLLERGLVRPVVDRVFPLEQVQDAHRYLESSANFGKVLLTLR
jgi:NADPH:quinone reductase-like Zn-dependent oxidoreductase